jgi:hypothetical protein
MRNSVGMSKNGKVIAVGANENDVHGRNSGHVRVFGFEGGAIGWKQMGVDINGKSAFEFTGSAVDLSADGHTLAVGAHAEGTTSGHVRVYTYRASDDSWHQKGADIVGEEAYDYSGAAIDMSDDGNIVAVGAYKNGWMMNGHVRVYRFNKGKWVQIGKDIDGEEVFSQSGVSVSLSANGYTLAVGAKENNGANGMVYHAGHVRIYKWTGKTWSQQGLDINGEGQHDYSGSAVDMSDDGSIVAIGAYLNDGNGADAGHVRIYEWSRGGKWVQMGKDIDGQAAYDNFGISVDLSSNGRTIAIGAWGNDNAAGMNAGHAQVYTFEGYNKGWVQKGASMVGEAAWDHSGSSVDISGDGHIVAVGARWNDENGNNAGHVRVWSSCAHLGDEDGDTHYSTDHPSAHFHPHRLPH